MSAGAFAVIPVGELLKRWGSIQARHDPGRAATVQSAMGHALPIGKGTRYVC